jgi:lipopolysaccharide transport system ATP-binding protein
MSSEIAIRVDGLGKQYRIGTAPAYGTFRDALSSLTRLPARLRRSYGSANGADQFWALKDVSFEVKRGEVVGIIGRNGAGKSTLLKILARITEPTEGGADIFGRVGSLLEVGTGFHPELTGRENIFLNGAILGMRRAEILRKFDEIVAFAEVEKFIDTPVKHYSSGMYMRLAFAVAAHLEPEVLIVDEVLAVGDAEFQKKCLGKMGEVAKQGRTVLFVSHNMHAVNSLCSRAIVLDRGNIVFDGPASHGVGHYLALAKSAAANETPAAARGGTGAWRFIAAAPDKPVYEPAEPKVVTFGVAPTRAGAGRAYLSAHLVDSNGAILSQFDSRLGGLWISGQEAMQGRLRVDGFWLKPGRYAIDLFVCAPSGVIDQFEHAIEFEVSPALPYPQPASQDAIASALVLADFNWSLDGR